MNFLLNWNQNWTQAQWRWNNLRGSCRMELQKWRKSVVKIVSSNQLGILLSSWFKLQCFSYLCKSCPLAKGLISIITMITMWLVLQHTVYMYIAVFIGSKLPAVCQQQRCCISFLLTRAGTGNCQNILKKKKRGNANVVVKQLRGKKRLNLSFFPCIFSSCFLTLPCRLTEL